jgi:hypothetical protein
MQIPRWKIEPSKDKRNSPLPFARSFLREVEAPAETEFSVLARLSTSFSLLFLTIFIEWGSTLYSKRSASIGSS